PSMYGMHDRERGPVGAWDALTIDADGLALEGTVSPNARLPNNVPVIEAVRNGSLCGLSLGFKVVEQRLDPELRVREILEIDLFECSLVDRPGDPLARVEDVKSDADNTAEILSEVARLRAAMAAEVARADELDRL